MSFIAVTLTQGAPPPRLPTNVLSTTSTSYTNLTDHFYGPWFLTHFGMLVRDLDRALEQSDYPVYTGRNFAAILKYLPRLPQLARKFERLEDGTMKQNGSIFYVVEGHNEIYANAGAAEKFWRRVGNPYLAINVAESYNEALKLVEKFDTNIRVAFRPPLIFFEHYD
ncbi:hypothetical protein B0H13DRAFT_2373327 [Mycena leptocephala]|nr:hypothetical protein B0H13DRAFT_2373327 [Mycena leptocephala]